MSCFTLLPSSRHLRSRTLPPRARTHGISPTTTDADPAATLSASSSASSYTAGDASIPTIPVNGAATTRDTTTDDATTYSTTPTNNDATANAAAWSATAVLAWNAAATAAVPTVHSATICSAYAHPSHVTLEHDLLSSIIFGVLACFVLPAVLSHSDTSTCTATTTACISGPPCRWPSYYSPIISSCPKSLQSRIPYSHFRP